MNVPSEMVEDPNASYCNDHVESEEENEEESEDCSSYCTPATSMPPADARHRIKHRSSLPEMGDSFI